MCGVGDGSRNPIAMQLTSLPYTLFLEIVSYLSPTELVRSRRTSIAFHEALTVEDLCISLILLQFPRSQEGRKLQYYLSQDQRRLLDLSDWSCTFALLARRYYHLGKALPWKTSKIDIVRDEDWFRGVAPWNRVLRLDEKTAPFHYWDPVWTFAPKEGLLLYPTLRQDSAELGRDEDRQARRGQTIIYRARDLQSGKEIDAPFDTEGKVIRRIRLTEGVLIFEWCEENPSFASQLQAPMHRHFVTAYDVHHASGFSQTDAQKASYPKNPLTEKGLDCTIAFRSEWEIHSPGLGLNDDDRFFSTHNRTHYVLYTRQPPASPWADDSPLERLVLWKIGSAPLGKRPSALSASQLPDPLASDGPKTLWMITNEELDWWFIRQRNTPSLRNLALDNVTWDESTNSACGHVFLIEEDHRWSAGPHSSSNPPRLHLVKSTGIPLSGHGPRWLDKCGAGADDGANFIGMSFCGRASSTSRPKEKTSLTVPWNLRDPLEEDWPGLAPCWRHSNFPYLTVSEANDVEAGVRIIARHCFMLETLSVNVRPRLLVQAAATGGEYRGEQSSVSVKPRRRGQHDNQLEVDSSTDSEGASSLQNRVDDDFAQHDADVWEDESRREGTRSEGPDGEETHFADDMWCQLLGKGYICGNERWLVGEDMYGDITILEF